MMSGEQGKILLSTFAKVNDGDYIDPKDRLLYCGICHAPKQIRIPAGYGNERVVTCLCKCQEALYAEGDPYAG